MKTKIPHRPTTDRRATDRQATDYFQRLCVALDLPTPIAEYRFHPSRRWRFDYAWPDQSIAVEVEGGVWTRGRHTRGKGYLGDMEKYNEAASLGWRVYRFTPKQVADGTAITYLVEIWKRV